MGFKELQESVGFISHPEELYNRHALKSDMFETYKEEARMNRGSTGDVVGLRGMSIGRHREEL